METLLIGWLLGPLLCVALAWVILGSAALWRLIPRGVTFLGALVYRLALLSWVFVVLFGLLSFIWKGITS